MWLIRCIISRRIFSFNEYRRLHAVIDGTDDARYSFVVSALLAAVHGIGNAGGNDNTGIGSGSAAVERLTGVFHSLLLKLI